MGKRREICGVEDQARPDDVAVRRIIRCGAACLDLYDDAVAVWKASMSQEISARSLLPNRTGHRIRLVWGHSACRGRPPSEPQDPSPPVGLRLGGANPASAGGESRTA